MDEQIPLQDVGETVFCDLQGYLAGFENLLKGHIENIAALKQTLSAAELDMHNCGNYKRDSHVGQVEGMAMTLPTHYKTAFSGAVHVSELVSSANVQLELFPYAARSQNRAYDRLSAHSADLGLFLQDHLRNLETLRKKLDPNATAETEEGQDNDGKSAEPLGGHDNGARPDHSARYSTIVLMSTFTAGLIVAFMQLMNDILPPLQPDTDAHDPHSYAFHYRLGFGFGFVGLVWNLCVAIVAGANTVVEASASRNDPRAKPAHPDQADGAVSRISPFAQAKKRFARRSIGFAIAQCLGSAIFGSCIGILYYPMHSGHILWVVPACLFPISLGIAAYDLSKSVSRGRKK